MLVIPRRKIWNPLDEAKRKWQRFLASFQEGKMQRDPTTGKLKRNANGKLVRNSADSSACCCDAAGYIQARRCSDNTYVDLWIPDADLPLSYFRQDDVCYYIADDSTTSETPGTIYDPEVVTITNCDDSDCCENAAFLADPPDEVLITIDGLETQCCGGDTGGYLALEDLNGSFTLPLFVANTWLFQNFMQLEAYFTGPCCEGEPETELEDDNAAYRFVYSAGTFTVSVGYGSSRICELVGTTTCIKNGMTIELSPDADALECYGTTSTVTATISW